MSTRHKKIVNLGSVSQIPMGQGICFVINGDEVAVFRSRDGGIFAIENQCPHRQGPLSEGLLGSGVVVCPLHGHKFNLATGEGSEPQECVRTFNVREVHQEILIEYIPSIKKQEVPFCGVDGKLTMTAD